MFISKTKQKTFKSQRFAMELFQRFDIDEGGTTGWPKKKPLPCAPLKR